MESEEDFKFFYLEKCRLCGECLSRCPVLHLPLKKAKEEKEKLNRGEPTDLLLSNCTGCFNCNDYCPQGVNPAEQIIYQWYLEYCKKGVKERARYFLTHQALNFRSYVVGRLPEDEKALLKLWDDTSSCEEIIYPGCNVIAVPYLTTRTTLFQDFTIRGALNWCCGETFYRMGYYEEVKKIARQLEVLFEQMGTKHILMLCTAGANMFSRVLPERFGAKFSFTITPLLRWIWDGLESGLIQPKARLSGTVTIQDSCYSQFFGPEYLELPRKILRRLGMEVIEMSSSCQNMRCCGIGGGFSIKSGYHLGDIIRSTVSQLREAKRTGAQFFAVYCAGCLLTLSMGKLIYPTRQPIYHLIEILQLALGETPLRRINPRVRTMLRGILRHQLPRHLSRRRFYPALETRIVR